MLLLSIGAVFALPPMPKLQIPVPAWEMPASEICLPSGLLVDVIERPASGIVAVTTVIGGGHAAEDDATRGAAHLIEHLWFRSRPGHGPRLEDRWAGLDTDALTADDATFYMTVGGPRDLRGILALEVERLRDPLQGIDDATVANEREVVASELLWRGEHSYRAANRLIAEFLWPEGHPYAQTVTSLTSANALDLSALRAYVGRSYRPENVAIRIEGAVDPEVVARTLTELLPAEMVSGEAPCGRDRSTAPPPAPARAGLVQVEAPVLYPTLVVAWSLPAALGPEEPQLRFAVQHLESILITPLYRLHGIGIGTHRAVDCRYLPGQLASTMSCLIELPNPKVASDAWSAMKYALAPTWGTESYTELADGASGEFRAAFTRIDSFDTAALRHRAFSTWLGVVDPTALSVDAALGKVYETVPPVVERWLAPDRAVAVLLVPGGFAHAGSTPAEPSVSLDAPPLPDWQPGAPAWVAEAVTLDNGLEIWTSTRRDTPYLGRATMVHLGGWATSPIPGVAERMSPWEVSISVTPTAVRQEVGTDFYSTSGPMHQGFVTVFPAENVRFATWLHGVFLEARRGGNPSDFEWDRVFDDLRLQPYAASAALHGSWLLPGDRASLPWWERAAGGPPESAKRAWEQTVLSPNRTRYVVTAPLEPTRIRAEAEAAFGKRRSAKSPVEATLPPLPPAPDRRTWVLEWENADVAEVLVTCRLPGRTDENAAAFRVLAELLDFGAWRNLREGLGIYGTGVTLTPIDPRLSLLEFGLATTDERAAVALDTVRALLDLAANGAPESAIAWSRRQAEGRLVRDLASGAGVHELLTEAAAEGRSLEGVRDLRANLGRVDAAAIRELLRDCAGHEAATVIGSRVPDGVGERFDWRGRAEALVESFR